MSGAPWRTGFILLSHLGPTQRTIAQMLVCNGLPVAYSIICKAILFWICFWEAKGNGFCGGNVAISQWNHEGMEVASQWNGCDIAMVWLWHHDGMVVRSQWNGCDITLEWLWHHICEDTVEMESPLLCYIGITMEQMWCPLWHALMPLWLSFMVNRTV